MHRTSLPRRLLMCGLVAALASGCLGCANFALAQTPSAPVPASDNGPPDRLADLLAMQLATTTTRPPSPPMSGVEATLVYQAYLAKRGQDAKQAAKPADSGAPQATTGSATP